MTSRSTSKSSSVRNTRPTVHGSADSIPSGDWTENLAAASIVACLWVLTGAMLAGRLHLVYRYVAVSGLPAWAELFVAPMTCFLLLVAVGGIGPGVLVALRPRLLHWTGRYFRQILVYQLMACVPFVVAVLRDVITPGIEPSFWEMVWFCGWSGVFVYKLVGSLPGDHLIPQKLMLLGFLGLCLVQIIGAVLQSYFYYDSLMVGFNDAGHFTQRVANTASGNGFLLESPVLPPFWDHFNPGLLLLVPLWLSSPDVQTFFWVQPIAISLGAWLVFKIAKEMKFSTENAIAWGISWLVLPVIGQINLTYTYSWHPVVLGIPFLLLAYFSWQRKHHIAAVAACILACSFEEGIIVVVGCFAAAQAIRQWFESKPNDRCRTIAPWGLLWGGCVIAFLMVYAWSGLAEFQSARFARLGESFTDILLSPILNPTEFWGLLLRPRNFAFLAVWFLPALVMRGWQAAWTWIALIPPFLVLLVWEHEPAQSIAFQYTSTLLPLLLFGCMETHASWIRKNQIQGGAESAPAIAFLLTAFLLSIFVGQFWWSQESLADVKGKTYGVRETDGRRLGDEDMVWIEEKLAEFPNKKELRILSTGRLAFRFVGAKDIETVGQYWVREKELAELASSLPTPLASPLLAYDWILLDHYEEFQQSSEDTKKVSELAAKLGFQLTKQAYGFEIWRNPTVDANPHATNSQ